MKKTIIIAIIAVVLLIAVSNAFYVVEENQYACTFRFSEIVNTVDTAGAHFKIPFVDSVEVSMESPSHIKIRVYEKTLIGYVEYMGSNLYFDKRRF